MTCHHPRESGSSTLVQGGPWPYGDTPVWVLTKGGVEIPERLKGNWANSWHSRWLVEQFLFGAIC